MRAISCAIAVADSSGAYRITHGVFMEEIVDRHDCDGRKVVSVRMRHGLG